MKTILNHDGKELIVTSIHMLPNGSVNTVYAIDDETGDEKRYVSSSHSPFHSEDHVTVENLGSKLDYVEIEESIAQRIQEQISRWVERADELANDFITIYSSDLGDYKKVELIEMTVKYKSIQDQIVGLQMAIAHISNRV